MHPAINREVSATRIADFCDQARREARSREAARMLHANKSTAHAAGTHGVAARLRRRVLALIAIANRAMPSTAVSRHGDDPGLA